MRVSVHPIFWVVVVVAIIYAATNFLLALLAAVLLHELGHALMAKCLGIVPSKISLLPFGGAINLQTNFLTPKQKSLIYLAGPVTSLLLTLFFGVLVWLFPVLLVFCEYLVAANFLVGVMNLLPIFPLDGGKIMAQLVKPKYILIWSNLTFGIVLLVALWKFNFLLIFFAVVTLVQINWEGKSSLYQDKFAYRAQHKIGQFVKCAVDQNTTLLRAYQLINRRHPTEFVVVDANNYQFNETDLEQWLLSMPVTTNLRQIVIRH